MDEFTVKNSQVHTGSTSASDATSNLTSIHLSLNMTVSPNLAPLPDIPFLTLSYLDLDFDAQFVL